MRMTSPLSIAPRAASRRGLSRWVRRAVRTMRRRQQVLLPQRRPEGACSETNQTIRHSHALLLMRTGGLSDKLHHAWAQLLDLGAWQQDVDDPGEDTDSSGGDEGALPAQRPAPRDGRRAAETPRTRSADKAGSKPHSVPRPRSGDGVAAGTGGRLKRIRRQSVETPAAGGEVHAELEDQDEDEDDEEVGAASRRSNAGRNRAAAAKLVTRRRQMQQVPSPPSEPASEEQSSSRSHKAEEDGASTSYADSEPPDAEDLEIDGVLDDRLVCSWSHHVFDAPHAALQRRQ